MSLEVEISTIVVRFMNSLIFFVPLIFILDISLGRVSTLRDWLVIKAGWTEKGANIVADKVFAVGWQGELVCWLFAEYKN